MSFFALIAGPMASGKTTTCKSIHTSLGAAGYPVYGLVEETERDMIGHPLRISFSDLSTGRKWLWTERLPGNPQLRPFVFPEKPLREALDCLSRAVNQGARPIILDELGLLEIDERKGFLEWVSDYLGQKDAFLIASLRKGREEGLLGLLDREAQRGVRIETKLFEIEEKNQAACRASVIEWTLRHCPNPGEKVY